MVREMQKKYAIRKKTGMNKIFFVPEPTMTVFLQSNHLDLSSTFVEQPPYSFSHLLQHYY